MTVTLSKAWLSVAYIIVLPLASPYGVGIHAGTATPSRHNAPSQFSSSIKALHMPPPSAANKRTVTLMQKDNTNEQHVAAEDQIEKSSKSNESNPSSVTKKRHLIPRFLSAVLYTYVDPLLQTASERKLEETDVFSSPEIVKMNNQVPKLESIYSRCKAKAQNLNLRGSPRNPQNKSLKKKMNVRVARSESLILAKAIILHQKKNIIITGLLRLLNTIIQAFPALLVARLLRLIEAGDSVHVSQAIKAAVDLVAVLSVKMVVENQYFHSIVKCSTMVRGSLSGMIFDKSLTVSSTDHKRPDSDETADGEKGDQCSSDETSTSSNVLNLVQSDVAMIENTALQIHTVWDGLLQICIYSTLLYKYLGKSVLWGMVVLLGTIPTNAASLRVLNRLGKLELKAKDARTRKTNEAILNMKLLKLNAWEEHFKRGIEDARKEELKRHMNRGAFRALNQAISNAIPAIVLVVTLTAYRKSGRPIVASTIFTAISLFNQLRFPLLFYPLVIDSIANGKNALGRLSSYLCQENLTRYVRTTSKSVDEGGQIEMKNGNFLWAKPSSSGLNENPSTIASPALCNADINVKAGEIVAVVGSVGAGKSALIKALLGELEPVPRLMVDASMGHSIDNPVDSGSIATVTTKGDVAYCVQEAWLPIGSIKDAVLFGREYDEARYLTAIYDAGLDEDLSSGTLSHDTDVGEGGSSLSGGQRARVQLARAMYGENTGVYLLDDPLSALDAAVGATVFDRITKRMRERKAAAVFVTNDVSLPRRCDRVILMGKTNTGSSSKLTCSQIEDIGTYDELIFRGHDLSSITIHPSVSESDKEESSTTTAAVIEHEKNSSWVSPIPGENLDVRSIEECNIQDSPETVNKFTNVTNSIVGEKVENKKKKKELVSTFTSNATTMDDTMSEGAVSLSTYITYFKAVRSPLLIGSALGCYLMANGAQFFQQFVVAKWTELGKDVASALGGKYLQSLVYAAGVVSVFLWLRSYLLMCVGARASEFLHNRMLTSVFNSPVTFFDSTPSGQLLSRFGKELETVDRSVPDGIGSVLFCFLNIAITVAGLTGLMTPAMLGPLLLITFFYSATMSKFRPTARDLKRFESKSRSPIYTQFGEALKGVETIRSFPNSSKLWSSEVRSRIDKNLGVIYSVKALDRWLSIRLESLGNIVVLTAAFMSVALTRAGKMKSGSAGWGLTQSLAITGLLTWAVRTLTDYETAMMSVMRINEVTGLEKPQKGDATSSSGIPQEKGGTGEALEALFGDEANKLPPAPNDSEGLIASGWPWKGSVSFENVSMRYNPSSDLALRSINLDIPAGTTLGVVGRTGSGKSTLLVTLFRLVEIESTGSIFIDGVDLRSVSLKTLRESLSIIPQDPVLFEGTLLYNLDATGKATTDDVWKALEKASPTMYWQFRTSPNGLESMISEGGKNLSAGQRQLICLARALLRNSKILVLDEATSSVDPKTDSQIQETIRREFVSKGVSVITVAHRLDTVLGSDKIAVLGNGAMIEYGSPDELLNIPNGELRRLVDADNRNKKKGSNIMHKSQPALATS